MNRIIIILTAIALSACSTFTGPRSDQINEDIHGLPSFGLKADPAPKPPERPSPAPTNPDRPPAPWWTVPVAAIPPFGMIVEIISPGWQNRLQAGTAGDYRTWTEEEWAMVDHNFEWTKRIHDQEHEESLAMFHMDNLTR